MLKSLDLEYHNLNPKKGLYYGLLEEGRVPRLTTDKAIDMATEHPPRNTRAFARGELVRHLLTCGPPAEPHDSKKDERFFPSYVINWSIFQLRGQAPFPMPDPFKTYVQEVRSHLSGS
jgi:proteasome accessory factor A